MESSAAPDGREAASADWAKTFASLGYPETYLLAAGMEGFVFRLDSRLVAKVWLTTPHVDVEKLQHFYAALARHKFPFATPEIEKIVQIDGVAVSIEQALPGVPLRSGDAPRRRVVAPSTVECLMLVLRTLASVPVSADLASLPVLAENEQMWQGYTRWNDALAALLERRVGRFGQHLRSAVGQFDKRFSKLLRLLDAVTPRPSAVIHGDLVPPNLLVDAKEQPVAVLDFGFFSTVSDPAFDAAVAACIFDMYGPYARQTEALLTREVALRFAYPPDELTLYKAAYAIATSNAYDPEGRDGHFAWCVQLLQRADVRSLVPD